MRKRETVDGVQWFYQPGYGEWWTASPLADGCVRRVYWPCFWELTTASGRWVARFSRLAAMRAYRPTPPPDGQRRQP